VQAKFSRMLIEVALAFGVLTWGFIGTAWAERATQLEARVSIAAQVMEVLVDGRPTFVWKVSTAGKGYTTPTGSWKPTRLEAMWYSRQYDNAPMPHAVFFHEGYAVHATNMVKRLGRPASHGCVRLHPDDAADFFALVATFGAANTTITITE
jgi:lipoprotein-anchoring transpeptidase ErfK/SrfK